MYTVLAYMHNVHVTAYESMIAREAKNCSTDYFIYSDYSILQLTVDLEMFVLKVFLLFA